MGVLSANTALSRTATGKIELQLGANKQLSLSIKKRLGPKSSVAPSLRVHRSGVELGVRYHRRYTSHLSSYIGFTCNADEFKNAVAIRFALSAGIAVKLTKYTKASYALEVGEGEVHAVVGVTRGGMNIRVPIALTNVVSFNNVLLCGVAVALCAYATKQLHSYLYDDPLKPSKKAKKEEQRHTEVEEGRKAAEEYVIMIRNKAQQAAQSEEERKGLVMLEALYGKKSVLERVTPESTVTSAEVFDVTAQLQVLVEHHRLIMPPMPKYTQYGFFNPCLLPGEPLALYIKFSYGGHVQSRLFADTEAVILP